MEEQIRKTISSIEHNYYDYVIDTERDYEEEYPGYTKDWLAGRIVDLYLLILTYFEAKGMPHLLESFKSKFSELIKDDKKIMDGICIHPEAERELKVIVEFKKFLDAFPSFDNNQLREDEKKKLISVLKNTGFIIKNAKATVKFEADIYKEVKWVLSLYYPSCRRRNKASFIQEFKSYNPDILIPELKMAIEYKYVNQPSDNLDDFIDQLKIDSGVYTGDYRYDTFIAVIYIEDISIATPESIDVAWKSKKFPNNWELVVAGNSSLIINDTAQN